MRTEFLRYSKAPMSSVNRKAAAIRLLLTDCDGVLTDGTVYYSAHGEEMKRFSLRDGMGVERLRQLVGVEVGIITGECSLPVQQRAAKLNIVELHEGVKDKAAALRIIIRRLGLRGEQVAYIGDDTNDLGIMGEVGLTACPADALPMVQKIADVVCGRKGGEGAFREFAELIIEAKCEGKGSY